MSAGLRPLPPRYLSRRLCALMLWASLLTPGAVAAGAASDAPPNLAAVSEKLPSSEPGLEFEICFNYGCLTRTTVTISRTRFAALVAALQQARDAEDERRRLAVVIGKLYALAAEQTPIGSDKGGNYADDGVSGRMDCIDHATTTTRFLQALAASGALHWHRVQAPERRLRFFLLQHFSAVIETLPPRSPARYVVDSWFVDNGEAAIILPLEDWRRGAGPDV